MPGFIANLPRLGIRDCAHADSVRPRAERCAGQRLARPHQRAGNSAGAWALIAFTDEPSTVRQILNHLGESGPAPAHRPSADHRCGRPQRPSPQWATIRTRNWPPNRYRRSNSISALPGEEQLLPRAGKACVFGAPHRRFLVWTRPVLAVRRVGEVHYRLCQRFKDENVQLTGVPHPRTLGVVHLNFLSFTSRAGTCARVAVVRQSKRTLLEGVIS